MIETSHWQRLYSHAATEWVHRHHSAISSVILHDWQAWQPINKPCSLQQGSLHYLHPACLAHYWHGWDEGQSSLPACQAAGRPCSSSAFINCTILVEHARTALPACLLLLKCACFALDFFWERRAGSTRTTAGCHIYSGNYSLPCAHTMTIVPHIGCYAGSTTGNLKGYGSSSGSA